MAPATSRRYEHLAPLGSGGMADVFLARAPDGAIVALKRLRMAGGLTEGHRRQLEREASISSVLQHPNVVAFKELGEDERGPYLALDYVEGVSANELLKGVEQGGAPLALTAAMSLCLDIARGIAYAHGVELPGARRGIVHRDISLSNVLVGVDGIARVADFGIAQVSDQTRMTATGAVRGKLAYLAPELFHGAVATFESDCFALACTAFELFAGIKPFRGSNDAELMNSLLNGQPASLLAMRPSVDARLADWVQRALSREPARRGPASELVERLTELVGSKKHEGEHVVAQWVKKLARKPMLGGPDGTATVAVPAAAKKKSRVPWVVGAGVVLLTVGAAGAFAIRKPAPVVETRPPEPAPIAVAQVQVPVPVPPPEVPEEPAPAVEVVKPEPAPATKPGRKPARPTRKPAPKPVAATGNGTLRLDVTPAAVVFVDGKRVGETPLEALSLAPGEHVLLLVSRAAGVSQSKRVRIEAGETTRLSVSLEAK